MKKISLILILSALTSIHCLIAQNVGVGTSTPNTKLDINGDVAWRSWLLPLINGANGVISPSSDYSYYRISGPTAAFSIAGLSNSSDGRLVTLYNSTTQTMTVLNMNGAAGASGIRAGSTDLSIGAWGSVTLQYNTTDNIWVVVNSMNAVVPSNDWAILGNTGTNDALNFLGTTDAQDLVVKTNNLEVMRAKDDQTLGIGTTTSPFAYGLSKVEIVGDATKPHISYASTSPSLLLMRHGGTHAAPTTLSNGDNVGELRWYAHNGSTYMQTARILSYIDGPVTPTSVPGDLRFMTNTAGNNLTDEKVIIKNNGRVGIGTFSLGGPFTNLHLNSSGANWNTGVTYGDFFVGDFNYGFRLGLATGGVGAGDVRLTASGGTNRLMLGGGANTSVLTVAGTSQKVGINTFEPNNTLDVFGDLALKTTAATLTGVAPNYAINSTTTPRSYYRISTPTANFNITSMDFAPAVGTSSADGRIVTLLNATTFTMKINNQDITAAAANRIVTGTGADLNIAARGSVTMVYNTTDNRWVVKDYNGGATGGNEWKLDGNNNNALRSIGTNDAFDFPMETNGTEKAVLTTGGALAVGNAVMGMNVNLTGFDKMGTYSDGFGYVGTHSVENATWSDYFVNTKSRGTGAAPAIVSNGDFVGGLWGNAYDGTAYQWMTSITSLVDGVPGAGDMPGRLAFGTSPDGSAYPIERMRITNAGNVGINTTAPTSKLHVYDAADANKITTYSESRSTNTGTDWESIGVLGYGRGASTSWGYGAGIVGLASPADAWGAVGVYARLGNTTPSLDLLGGSAYNYALYSDAAGLGYAGIFMNGNVGIRTQSPTRAVLETRDMVGNTAAIFSQNNNGISLVASWPGVYYNSYFNGSNLSLQAGFSGNISMDPGSGRYIFNTNANAGAADAAVVTTERMTLTNNGRLGIGTAAPSATRLHAYDPTAGTVRIGNFQNSTFDGTELQVGSIEYWHDYSSTVDFNNGANTVGLTINLAASSAYDLQVATNSAGKPTSGAWTIVSDARLKEDVAPFKDGLGILRAINPVTFHYNGKAHTPNEYGIGVIAQDMKEVAPYMVGKFQILDQGKDISEMEEYYSYNPDALHYVTLNAVKELDAKQQIAQEVFENISDFGVVALTAEETFIPFSQKFQANLGQNALPVVTLTALGGTPIALTIVSQQANGFTVKAANLTQPVQVNWIAMAKVNATIYDRSVIAFTPSERAEMIQKVKLPEPKLKERYELEMEGLKQRRANGEFVVLPGETPEQAKANSKLTVYENMPKGEKAEVPAVKVKTPAQTEKIKVQDGTPIIGAQPSLK